jgi:hypothetical protein
MFRGCECLLNGYTVFLLFILDCVFRQVINFMVWE